MAAQSERSRFRGAAPREPGHISVFTVVAVCIGTTVVAHFGEFAVGVLGPALEADLNIESSQLGLLVALMFVCSALGAVPSGFLADHVDARKLILIQVTTASLAFGSFAIVVQAGHLFISVALVGAAISLNVPMTNRLVVDFVPKRSQSAAVAWKSMGLQVSGLLTGLTFGLTEPFAPWRVTVVVTAGIMLALGAIAHLVFRRARPVTHDHGEAAVGGTEAQPPAMIGSEVAASPGSATPETAAPETAKPAPEPPEKFEKPEKLEQRQMRRSTRVKIAEPIIWWMIPYSLLTVGAFTAVGTYMVLYATTDAGVSAAAAANASGIAAGVSLAARFAWVRWLTDHNEVFMLFVTAASAAVAVILLAMSPIFGPVGFWVAAIAIGVTVLATGPVRQVILLRNTHPRYIGRVTSVVGVASAVSLAGMPFLISQFISALGLQATWYIVAGITMLGAATILVYAVIRALRRSAAW